MMIDYRLLGGVQRWRQTTLGRYAVADCDAGTARSRRSPPMIEIKQEIETDASPTEAFDFVADPQNHPKFSSAISDISDVHDGEVGKEGEWTFKIAGVTMKGRFVDTEFDRPSKRSYELEGDLEGTETWLIEAANGGSRITYRTTVEVPGPNLLDTLAEPVAKRLMRNDAETKLENLQAFLDEQASTKEQPA